MHAAAASALHRRWVLLESSAATTAVLAEISPGDVVCCDLTRDELPSLDADVVVADPPWYPEHTRAFLWAAAQLTRTGAAVLLAQPAAATRPGVLAERAELLEFAHAAGLDLLPGLSRGADVLAPRSSARRCGPAACPRQFPGTGGAGT